MASWTLTDLERIELAIANGTRRVKFEDREVEYRSTSELLRLRDIIRKSLNPPDPNAGRSRATIDKEL
jgi:hypothetical protein